MSGFAVRALATTDSAHWLHGSCGCPGGRKPLPIRLAGVALALLRERLDPQAVVLDYRCRNCGGVVMVRAQDLMVR